MKNIAVLGFGRSGTTWIADIISKATGGLILFEPFHPSVTEMSKEVSYSRIYPSNAKKIKNLLNNVLHKQHRKMWLMRNHVPARLEETSNEFLELLWEQCDIIGFKEIRANFMLPWLQNDFQSKIVFIVRHPCAVIASILKRHNFWEFGWPDTYKIFLSKTIYSEDCRNERIKDCISIVENTNNMIEQYAIMWAITHAIALSELKELQLPLYFYEDFYSKPFESVRKLLNYICIEKESIHPAYIFTPSMTTLKTLHGLYGSESLINDGASFFWKDTLGSEQIEIVMNIIKYFGIDIYDKSGFPIREFNH